MSSQPTSTRKIAGATLALVLFTGLNLVNYIDRYILPGTQELIKTEFHLSDTQIGALTSWFFITYVIAAPLTGWLGDRFRRKPLIVVGALLWSGMNLLTATVHNYDSLLLRHAALGIGEASFGIYAIAVLSDFFAAAERNRVMTIFNMAIPVGAAIGYSLGGSLGEHYGWRAPFFVSAVPGIALALCVLFFVREPKRGESEEAEIHFEKGFRVALLEVCGAVKQLASLPAYLTAVGGYAMVTFMIGGISWWMASFLQRFHGDTATSAGFKVGAITAVMGLVGTTIGGVWAQRWLRRSHRALYLVPALSALLTIPPSLLLFFGPTWCILPSLAGAELFIFLGTGPINAAIVNSVPPRIRAMALAGELLLIHLLGDIPSPPLIGYISDRSDLRYGLAATVVALLLAAAVLFVGARYAPEESRIQAETA